MAIAKLLAKLRDEFSNDTGGERAWRVLPTLVENIRAAEAKFVRRITGVITLVMVFELISQAAVNKISVLGSEISNLHLVSQVIPAVLCYLYMSCVSLFLMRRLLEEVFDCILFSSYTALQGSRLQDYLRPQHTFSLYSILVSSTSGWASRLIDRSGDIILAGIILFTPIYAFAALVRLFQNDDLNPLLNWASLIISIVFILQALLLLGSTAQAVQREDTDVRPDKTTKGESA